MEMTEFWTGKSRLPLLVLPGMGIAYIPNLAYLGYSKFEARYETKTYEKLDSEVAMGGDFKFITSADCEDQVVVLILDRMAQPVLSIALLDFRWHKFIRKLEIIQRKAVCWLRKRRNIRVLSIAKEYLGKCLPQEVVLDILKLVIDHRNKSCKHDNRNNFKIVRTNSFIQAEAT